MCVVDWVTHVSQKESHMFLTILIIICVFMYITGYMIEKDRIERQEETNALIRKGLDKR